MWISLSLSIAMWIYQYGFSLCFSNKRVARTQIWLACGLSSWAYLRIYNRAMSLMSVVAAMVLAKMSLFESTPSLPMFVLICLYVSSKAHAQPVALDVLKPHLFKIYKDHFLAFILAARKSTEGLMKRNPVSLKPRNSVQHSSAMLRPRNHTNSLRSPDVSEKVAGLWQAVQ